MTFRNAEKITGLSIQPAPQQDGYLAYVGFDGEGIAVAAGRGLTSCEALRRLVENNYAELCRRVWTKQEGKCWECGRFRPLSFHHVVHRSKGRIDSEDNLRGLCQPCHGREHGT